MEEEQGEEKSALRYILAVFLVLLIVVFVFPIYSIKLDPRPTYVPTIDEVFSGDVIGHSIVAKSRYDYLELIDPTDTFVKTLASKIISLGCKKQSNVCHAKVLYYFVRDNFNYISDPISKEYVEDPKVFISSRGGDCESGAIFLGTLLESVGINTEMVFVPGHAFLRILLPDAIERYKKNKWIYLDWTCSDCEFGEVGVYERMTFMDIP